MEPASDCLVRYGLMGHVGWFALDSGPGPGFERGRAVVVRTSRGVELGEVLIVPEASEPNARSRAPEDSVGAFRVLRPAADDDLALGREAEGLRKSRFDACRRIVSEAGWPLELIDVEPLLDRTTVLHYVGVDGLDLGPIRARFRASCEFDVGFEDLRAGLATARPPVDALPAAPRKGGCGDCDCGAGGCGTAAEPTRQPQSSHSGCSGCGVAALLKDRRRAPRLDPAASASS
jgi:hypothetical protein